MQWSHPHTFVDFSKFLLLRNGLANSILSSTCSVLCNKQLIFRVSCVVLHDITTFNLTFVDF